jgi:tetratricopeptide (TPR) repeat protein
MNPSGLQNIFTISLWIGIVITAIGTIGSQYYSKKVDQYKEQKTSATINTLNEQNKELIDGKNELIKQNKDLSEKIGRYQQDLQEKEEKIKELDKKAKMAARGVTSIYIFNGAKKETFGGNINTVAGEEFGVFQEMVALEQSKEYPALVKLCEQQITKTPSWLTPYLYLGIAQANTGLKDEAIKNIRYVVNNAPGDPEYAEAGKILKQLEQVP